MIKSINEENKTVFFTNYVDDDDIEQMIKILQNYKRCKYALKL